MSEILADFAEGLHVFCHQTWVLSESMHWRRYLVADSGCLEESYFDIDSVRERTGSGVSRGHASRYKSSGELSSKELLVITMCDQQTCEITSQLSCRRTRREGQ